nr:MAG TPA: hypothetical protein [Caudoviricetes sp.]
MFHSALRRDTDISHVHILSSLERVRNSERLFFLF